MCQPKKVATVVEGTEGGGPTSKKETSIAGAAYTSQSSEKRSGYVDLACFLAPLMFAHVTNMGPIYLTAVLRMLSTHAFLCVHYVFVDKDNYVEKLPQKQLQREKKDYLVGIILHMWAQLALQLLFPSMFFPQTSDIVRTLRVSALATLATHVLLVEPLYYVVHRWLHVPEHMKAMHGFHHQSINTVPSTSLVQNFQEHFVYIATFGPAFFVPHFVLGQQHWAVILAYLVAFDIINAYGHTNIKCRHWLFTSPRSPLYYMLYTPEFHLGHHAYYNYNFGLFMPLWDHLCGTYRKYEKPPPALLPRVKQDFVFIGHNGGLGHLLTIPEFSVYNVYDSYRRTWLPIEVELVLVNLANQLLRLVAASYKVSRYLVDGRHIGRIICVLRTPIDYASPANYPAINKDILQLIRTEHRLCGTRYFGLGNLNKMKQLNDGGAEIARLVRADPELREKGVRVWTGDTLTAASVYHQVLALPNPEKRIFYVGAGGKIGNAVCGMLLAQGFSITIYSKQPQLSHERVKYTQDLRDMLPFKFVLIGKLLRASAYEKVLRTRTCSQYLLDYTVPFVPIQPPHGLRDGLSTLHVQIGVLKSTNEQFLRGYYDICMGTAQNHIYPCHAGCILNMVEGLESDETGDIVVADMDRMWKLALSHGLCNREVQIVV